MRILVIEDEAKVASFIRRALEEESYAVDVCADGAKGLEMGLSGSYDLIILDLMLPGLLGLEILKALRKEKIQAIVLTRGIKGFFTRPVSCPCRPRGARLPSRRRPPVA